MSYQNGDNIQGVKNIWQHSTETRFISASQTALTIYLNTYLYHKIWCIKSYWEYPVCEVDYELIQKVVLVWEEFQSLRSPVPSFEQVRLLTLNWHSSSYFQLVSISHLYTSDWNSQHCLLIMFTSSSRRNFKTSETLHTKRTFVCCRKR